MKKDWVEPAHRFPVPQKMYPFAVDENGVPSGADCNSIDWATSYLNYGVGNAFGRLYNNYDGLGDAFAAYWKTLATNYKGIPGVFGYNLMNGKHIDCHFYCMSVYRASSSTFLPIIAFRLFDLGSH